MNGGTGSERVQSEPLLRLKIPVLPRLGRVALVALQHLLPSIERLFDRFLDAGFSADRVFVLGKPYSSVPATAQVLAARGVELFLDELPVYTGGDYTGHFRATVHQFWQSVAARLPEDVDRVVVLDEGGWLRRDVPTSVMNRFEVVGVEHTMYGLFTLPAGSAGFPVVLMAASAAKTRFESRVIADAIVDRLFLAVPSMGEAKVGVLGLGNLGQAVAQRLHASGVENIFGFDIDNTKARRTGWSYAQRVRAVPTLIEQCEVVIGCTGRDALEPARLPHLQGRRWMASASSGNVEFGRLAKTLLRRSSTLRNDPFADARGNLNGADITLLNGGFPVNFNRQIELEDPVCIQLTRELTYASVMQAALCVDIEKDSESLKLDPRVQRELVRSWLHSPRARQLFPKWADPGIEWWERHSQGSLTEHSLDAYLTVE